MAVSRRTGCAWVRSWQVSWRLQLLVSLLIWSAFFGGRLDAMLAGAVMALARAAALDRGGRLFRAPEPDQPCYGCQRDQAHRSAHGIFAIFGDLVIRGWDFPYGWGTHVQAREDLGFQFDRA